MMIIILGSFILIIGGGVVIAIGIMSYFETLEMLDEMKRYKKKIKKYIKNNK